LPKGGVRRKPSGEGQKGRGKIRRCVKGGRLCPPKNRLNINKRGGVPEKKGDTGGKKKKKKRRGGNSTRKYGKHESTTRERYWE